MSDTEQVMETEEVATETTPAAEPAVPEKMDVLTALKEVLKTALVNDALARGLHECAKVLDRRQAHFCALAANCTEPAYIKLVEALCLEHNINLIKVPDSKQLGEWAGLCKIDNEGHPRKVVACSCVVVTSEFKKLSPAFEILLEHFRTNKA
ncbi:ribosomal protein S12, putative [Acanthamoeba castellanii str. Neff]|jgi:small subunit ribosomal protein S12e|uniref:40S ribosomal protein S12 n=1 Tax=Acanthamoeba castellanii (strain ATCC 30010 / Neff) TaxID=1257118 RepID=L8H0P3_ACACF|nr:ribosomal protein S12, putative [Acanthamoeba castellanii str. Neff]ELR18810.1 ribosomal protein S12, putative [Acanthamoeba castellanii str. Neff]